MQKTLFNDIQKGAVISDCGKYRYQLWRIWDDSKPKVLFLMLNPSTADSEQNDPTIIRCINFAKSWEYGGLYVGNLFAYRSTDPKGLLKPFDPVGKHNDYHITIMSEKCEIAVCAWGNFDIVKNMRADHNPIYHVKVPLYYLELSVNGTPKHPLYLKSNLKPIKYIP